MRKASLMSSSASQFRLACCGCNHAMQYRLADSDGVAYTVLLSFFFWSCK